MSTFKDFMELAEADGLVLQPEQPVEVITEQLEEQPVEELDFETALPNYLPKGWN